MNIIFDGRWKRKGKSKIPKHSKKIFIPKIKIFVVIKLRKHSFPMMSFEHIDFGRCQNQQILDSENCLHSMA